MSRWGLLFSHLGTAVVLCGGLLGNLFGFKGSLGLHEGESAGEAVSLSRKEPGQRRALGFSVRLEDFQMETYEPEYRFYVYRHEESPRAVQSFSLKEAQEFVSVGASGAEFRVSRGFPDFYQKAELAEAPPGEGRPALRVRTGRGAGARIAHLFADGPDRHALEADEGGCLIRFVWKRPTEEETARFARTSPERHVLAFREHEGSPLEEIDVQVGKTYTFGQGRWELEVRGYFPDFYYNMETKSPGTRSQEPKNPALSVALQEPGSDKRQGHWLFAKMPDFGRQHGKDAAFRLTYRQSPAQSPADRELLVVGETREVWDIEKGKVLKQTRLESNQGPLPGAPAAEFRIYPSAVERHSPATRSEEWKNPVVEIELRKASGTEKSLMAAEHGRPLRLPDGKTFLSFEPKPKEAKAYRSRLAILEQSQKALEQTIEVNHPLSYRGYKFYQSNYREDDPTYSGIQVVKDPGLPLVWSGLCMLSAGVVLSFYFWPRLPQRRYQ